MGVGRSRNTFAHELGHAVLHEGAPKARRVGGNVTPKFIRPYQSAEHQAKVFAPAFLINDSHARTLGTAAEIAIECGVSLESATIYFESNSSSKRAQLGRRIEKFARKYRESTMPPKQQIHFMCDPCNVCGNQTVFPIGIKFMCQTCDTVFDRFQDGDSVA